jgi:hypothetical protein
MAWKDYYMDDYIDDYIDDNIDDWDRAVISTDEDGLGKYYLWL